MIRTVQELIEEVSGPLTILVGSGVSLRGNIAPGVADFIGAALDGLADRAVAANRARDYATHRVGKLTKRLLASDARKKTASTKRRPHASPKLTNRELLKKKILRTKFEEFLRLCIDTRIDIGPILKAAYNGSSGAHNVNHSALAYLAHHSGITLLTTNFDLGVENAGFKTSVVPKNGSWPLRQKPPRAILAKLHGCASKGEFVATSGHLLSLRSSREFEFLADWCSHGTILMFGYSGTGDVDIALHLDQLPSPTKVLWANHDEQARVPFAQAKLVICDLLRDDSKNTLLELARKYGWSQPLSTSEVGWNRQALVEQLTAVSPFTAGRCLVEIIGRWEPKVFLTDYLAASRLSTDPSVRRSFFTWWADQRVDPPPLRTGHNSECRRFMREIEDIPGTKTYSYAWLAFADWRSGRQAQALTRIAALISSDLKHEHTEVRQRVHEFFLAILAERLWANRDDKQRSATLRAFADEIPISLAEITSVENNDGRRLESYFTGRLRALEVKFWASVSEIELLGYPPDAIGAIEELINLREQAGNLNVSDAAIGIDHSLLGIKQFCGKHHLSVRFPSNYSPLSLALFTIFTRKKRFAYRWRFTPLGRFLFQFLEVRMLWLWETLSRKPSLAWHFILLRWERYAAMRPHGASRHSGA